MMKIVMNEVVRLKMSNQHCTVLQRKIGRPRLFAGLILIVMAGGMTGCSSPTGGLPQQDYEKAKTALEKGLNAWKNGESYKKWFAPKAPIRFVDDGWKKGQRLLDYEIVQIRANTDGYPEAIVRLTLQSPKGNSQTTEEGLYGINVKEPNQVAIGRDPMY